MKKSYKVKKCSKCGSMAFVPWGIFDGVMGYRVECAEYHEYEMHNDKSKCNNVTDIYEKKISAIEAWNKLN